MTNATVKNYPELNAKIKLGFTPEGYPTAEIYTDKKGNPDYYYRFRTNDHREKYIDSWKRSRIEELKQN